MENIGVAVGIIIDNKVDEEVEGVIMSDDGTGGGLKIPSMLISYTDGQKILDFMKNATFVELRAIVVLASFEQAKPDDRVEYDIWFTSSNDKAMDFIYEFASTDRELGDKVLMTPHYVFWKCNSCEQKYLDNDCYANGRYCAIEPGNDHIKGREVI